MCWRGARLRLVDRPHSPRCASLYDIVRLDHFRGFEAYWAIPAEEETAVNGEWVKAPGLRALSRARSGAGAAAAGGRRPGPDYAGSGRAAPGAADAGHEGAAVRLRRQGRACAPAAPVHARHRGLHRHARQRHHAGLVEDGRRDGASARWRLTLVRPVRRQRAGVAADPRRGGERGATGDCSRAGSAGAWLGSAHEYALGCRRELELARAGGCWTPEIAERLAALAEVTDRENDPLGEPGETDSAEE